MSNAGTHEDKPPRIDDVDPEALVAAQALIDLSRTHIKLRDSPSCNCGSLRRMSQVILNADDYPETEAEDWQEMGMEFLRMRASGAYTKAALQVKTTADSEEKFRSSKKVLGTSDFEPASEKNHQPQGLCISGIMKQEDKAVISLSAELQRSKKTQLTKLKARRMMEARRE